MLGFGRGAVIEGVDCTSRVPGKGVPRNAKECQGMPRRGKTRVQNGVSE